MKLVDSDISCTSSVPFIGVPSFGSESFLRNMENPQPFTHVSGESPIKRAACGLFFKGVSQENWLSFQALKTYIRLRANRVGRLVEVPKGQR